jgi:hypothetical protein
MGYELDGGGIRVQFPARIRDVSLLQGVHTLSGTQSAPFEKAAPSEADRSPPSSSEIKKSGCTPPIPYTSLCSGSELIKHRKNVPFYFTFPLIIVTSILLRSFDELITHKWRPLGKNHLVKLTGLNAKSGLNIL